MGYDKKQLKKMTVILFPSPLTGEGKGEGGSKRMT